MARYAVPFGKATSSTTVGVGSLEQPGSALKRLSVYDLLLGSDAAPASNVLRYVLARLTSTCTGSAVTPRKLDPADGAASAVAFDEVTVEGTVTANSSLLSIAANQQATVRWVAAPGGELIVPATNNNGLILQTPVASNTPAVAATIHYSE